jgi:hypothetical protein
MGERLASEKKKSLAHKSPERTELEPSDWYIYLRMDSEAYLELLQKVTPRIRKCDNVMRRADTAIYEALKKNYLKVSYIF